MSVEESRTPATTIVDGGDRTTPTTTVVGKQAASAPTTVVTGSPATTVVSGNGAAGATLVARDAVAMEWVPPEVFARFPGLSLSAHAGAEAVVLTGDSPEYGPVAVKVYRPGLAAEPTVVAVLRERAKHDHVVALRDAFRLGGCWVEVLERIDRGSLSDLAGGRPVRGDDLRAVVAELAAAIEHFHSLGLIHRDIKPTNVLVRTDDPLDLVLADFGLSAILTDEVDLQAQNRTVMYASPETQMGLSNPAGDWWSLGIIVVELYRGRHPFAEFSNATILTHLIARDLDLSEIDDERWRMVCSGLLDRDPGTRWGADQVQEWLAGGSPAVHRQAPTRAPYEFGGEAFDSPESLLAAFSLDWSAAVARVIGQVSYRQLCDWLIAGAPGDGELAVTLDSAGDEVDGDARLLRLLRQLAPQIPAIYREYSLEGDGLARLAAAAVRAGSDSPELAAVDSLWVNRALQWLPSGPTTDQEWRDGFTAVSRLLSDRRHLDDTEVALARARILLVVCSADEARLLREQAVAAGRTDAGRIDWYQSLTSQAATSNTTALAAVLLRETAAAEAREEDVERKAARDSALRTRREATTRRYPRTRACLGWTVVVLVVLAADTLAARLVPIKSPGFYDGPVRANGKIVLIDLLGEGAIDNKAFEFFRPYLLGFANPLWVALLLSAGSVLWVRARRVGATDSPVTRSEWERRGMQAVIAGACAYFPLMAPFALLGLYRGLYATADPGVMREQRLYRRVLNVAGVGFLLHALAGLVTRSPQLAEWITHFPDWYLTFIAKVPPWLLVTVSSGDASILLVISLVAAGVTSLAIAARTLRGRQHSAESVVGGLLVPLGIYSLVPGLLVVGFYPLLVAGIVVGSILGVILVLVIIFGLLASS